MNKKLSIIFTLTLMLVMSFEFESQAQMQGGITNPPTLLMFRDSIKVDIKGNRADCQSTSLIPDAPQEAFNIDRLRPYLESSTNNHRAIIVGYTVFCPTANSNKLATVHLIVQSDSRTTPSVSYINHLNAKDWGANDGNSRPSPAERFRVASSSEMDNRSGLPLSVYQIREKSADIVKKLVGESYTCIDNPTKQKDNCEVDSTGEKFTFKINYDGTILREVTVLVSFDKQALPALRSPKDSPEYNETVSTFKKETEIFLSRATSHLRGNGSRLVSSMDEELKFSRTYERRRTGYRSPTLRYYGEIGQLENGDGFAKFQYSNINQ